MKKIVPTFFSALIIVLCFALPVFAQVSGAAPASAYDSPSGSLTATPFAFDSSAATVPTQGTGPATPGVPNTGVDAPATGTGTGYSYWWLVLLIAVVLGFGYWISERYGPREL